MPHAPPGITRLPSAKLLLPSHTLSITASHITITPELQIPRRALHDLVFTSLSTTSTLPNPTTEILTGDHDLIPGVYEGGFKTWECAQDLAAYLTTLTTMDWSAIKVLELGCGSAIPVCVARRLGCRDVVVQDYNADVVETLALPNIWLQDHHELFRAGEVGGVVDETGHFDANVEIGELVGVECHVGGWEGLVISSPADVILTSETVYDATSHVALIDAILNNMTRDGIAYVAAKTTYFGCSGSLDEFVRLARSRGLECNTVWKTTGGGVGREIVRMRRSSQ